jgi:hypothetical protein
MKSFWVVLHFLTALVALCWAIHDYLHALYGVPLSTLVWFLFGGAVILLVSAALSLTLPFRPSGWIAVAGSAALLVYFVPATIGTIRGFLRPLPIVTTIDLLAVIGTALLITVSFAGALSRVLRPIRDLT